MATSSHPYISGAGNISQMIKHLRSNFPGTVTSETVKKLGLASNNESYVINALQFIGVIDGEGKKTEKSKVLAIHKEADFQAAFEKLIREAYKDLFDLHGDKVWEMDSDELVHYFRQTDQTSAAIGQRQARVFMTFATVAGRSEVEAKSKSPNAAAKKPKIAVKRAKKEKPRERPAEDDGEDEVRRKGRLGLTVRIEINLPADGSKETYDNIFKSIKANLIDD